jgi:Na+-transporting NADH:ubiquinone oxidoreductase subunit NqrF
VLEGDELQNGYILACQTQLKTDIEVEVELLAEGEQQHHWESDAVIKQIRDLTHDIKELPSKLSILITLRLVNSYIKLANTQT